MSSLLSDKQKEVALLIANAGPGTQKDPRDDLSFTEIAKRCGTTAKTIREWRKDPAFDDYLAVCNTADTSAKVERMLVDHALTKGSERHAKLWIDKYDTRNKTEESRFDSIFGMSDDDLAHVRLQLFKHMAGEVAV